MITQPSVHSSPSARRNGHLYLQDRVNDQHELFKSEILASRPDVPAEAMDGLSYSGENALHLALIDELVDSFDDALDLGVNSFSWVQEALCSLISS